MGNIPHKLILDYISASCKGLLFPVIFLRSSVSMVSPVAAAISSHVAPAMAPSAPRGWGLSDGAVTVTTADAKRFAGLMADRGPVESSDFRFEESGPDTWKWKWEDGEEGGSGVERRRKANKLFATRIKYT